MLCMSCGSRIHVHLSHIDTEPCWYHLLKHYACHYIALVHCKLLIDLICIDLFKNYLLFPLIYIPFSCNYFYFPWWIIKSFLNLINYGILVFILRLLSSLWLPYNIKNRSLQVGYWYVAFDCTDSCRSTGGETWLHNNIELSSLCAKCISIHFHPL